MMDDWPLWLRMAIGCPLMILIALVGITLIASIGRPPR